MSFLLGENLFILSAGASAESGTPIMHYFLDIAEDIWRKNLFKENQNKIYTVFKLITKLYSFYAISKLKQY